MSSPTDREGTGPSAGSPLRALRQTFFLLLGMVAVSALAGVLLAGLTFPAISATSTTAREGVQLINDLPAELQTEPMSEASNMYAADGTLLATFYYQNRIIVPLEEISPHMQDAVIATEDRRFYEHNGVDPRGIVRAFISNAAGGDLQGASTLTQQYVKNALLFDAQARGDQEAMAEAVETTYARKIQEAKYALSVEQHMSKDEILAGYLNIAQFGPSQYGVETASRHYFSKSADDLTIAESALLAGITNGPNLYDPVSNPENAKERRDTILWTMRDQGVITEEEYQTARDTTLDEMLDISNRQTGCAVAEGAGFFCDYATRYLLNDPAFGDSYEEREEKLYQGGLTINTTLDPDLQAAAEDIVNSRMPPTHESGFGHTITTVEPGTGKVVTMAQNRAFTYSNPDPGETAVNYATNTQYGGGQGFSPGSAFKPFILTQWLIDGHTLMEKVPTWTIYYDDFRASCEDVGGEDGVYQAEPPYGVGNAVSVPLTPMFTALDATKFSVNTSYLDMYHQLDLCEVQQTATSLGVTNGDGSPYAAYPSSVFGTDPVAPLDMAAAYATFAADGKHCTPVPVAEVLDREGEPMEFTQSACEQVIDKDVAQAVAYTLQQDLEDPQATGKGQIIPGHDAGGKTGTSTNQYHTWYVGFSRQLSTAVWFGNPTANVRPQGMVLDGEFVETGSYWAHTTALPAWHDFMIRAHEGRESVPFAPVPQHMMTGTGTQVPAVAGMSPERARGVLEEAGFAVEIAPERVASPRGGAGEVSHTRPSSGVRLEPGQTVTLVISNGSTPRDPSAAQSEG